MNHYRITSRATGFVLGTYTSDTLEHALNVYARTAGYRDFATLAEVLDQSVEQARDDLHVEEVIS